MQTIERTPSATRGTGNVRRATVALVAAALLAAACGSGDEETTEATASPLAEFLGQGDFLSDPEAAQAQWQEEERRREETIAACMQRQGFEYTPVDYSQFNTFTDDIDDWGSEEWVAEWGFGITTQRFSQQQVGPNLKGWDDSQFQEAEEEFVDPNQDYLESLSESERMAYEEALWGPQDFGAFEDQSLTEEEIEAQFDEGFEWEPQGCQGEAYEAEQSNQFYLEFEDELQEMYERMEADPRITERTAEISQCVADKGLEYTDMEAMWERWDDDLAAIDPYADGGFESAMELSEEEMAQMTDEELDEFFSQNFQEPELSEEDRAKLGELQAEEIELAIAVTDCGGGFNAEWEMMSDIQAEYEQEFLDTYADELEPFRAG
ncbi:MAG: hypothetical protein AAGA93_08295 [Actinomycetota bacterium]